MDVAFLRFVRVRGCGGLDSALLMMRFAVHLKARFFAVSLAGVCFCSSSSLAAMIGDFIITPRLVGQELFTDNVLLTPTNRRADLITTISPGINITGESKRLQGTFDYSPIIQQYALTPGQSFIGQNLFANGSAIIVPDLFFLDARGSLSLQPSTIGLGTGLFGTAATPSLLGPNLINTTTALPRTQLAQVTSFSGSPYLARRFGDFGSAELRYTFSDTNFSGIQGVTPLTPTGTPLQNSSSTTNEVTAAFLTGENLGRLQSRVTLDAAQSSGTGLLNEADQVVGVVDSGYAITERIAALGTIGYEKIKFSGLPPIHIDDLVWGIGTKLTPNPDSTIVLSYGHRNGITAPYVALNYNVTARTALSVTYSKGITTVSQQIADNLAFSQVSQTGQIVDSRTLLPLLLINPTLGLQGGVFNTKQLTATATTSLERDQFTASIYRTENNVISQTVAGSATSETLFQTNLSWSRELSPRTSATLAFSYSEISFPLPANTQETLLNPNLSVTYQLGPSLTGSATYYLLDRLSNQPQSRLLANVFMVSLSKSF